MNNRPFHAVRWYLSQLVLCSIILTGLSAPFMLAYFLAQGCNM